jgi:Na+-transporting NADH:ubiquinone oxidoreductase subunit NqrF
MQRLLTDERGIATFLIVIFIVLGVVVVGVVATAAVVLSNDVAITVNNRSCGTLDVAQGSAALGLNFLPGINVPSQIAQGDTAVVQVPERFVDSVAFTAGSVEVRAFSRSFTLGTSRIDMQRSTWDGAPLAGLVGHQVELSGDHTLVLECK